MGTRARVVMPLVALIALLGEFGGDASPVRGLPCDGDPEFIAPPPAWRGDPGFVLPAPEWHGDPGFSPWPDSPGNWHRCHDEVIVTVVTPISAPADGTPIAPPPRQPTPRPPGTPTP